MLRRTRLGLLLCLAALTGGAEAASAGPAGEPAEVASGLDIPWDVVLPGDGRTLVVERPGRIRVVEGPGAGAVLLTGGPEVNKFLGLVPHPGYARNGLMYLYVNYRVDGGLRNRIVRLVDDGAQLRPDGTIFDGIGSDGNHDGGRMAFGPDGHLYVTTGDIHQPQLPQDRQSLNGKILRLLVPGTGDDGGAPADNPFLAEGGNARFVWSYGHRHPQGLAFDAAGRLYESEHGPSGENYGDPYLGGTGRCCRDELNLIERGANYGWPLISGTDAREGMRTPIATSGAGSTWAPGGLAVGSDGHLYMPALAGAHLREFQVCGGAVVAQTEHYRNRFGRLRAATAGPGGLLFTQDGDSARVLRVPLGPAAACPPPGSTSGAAAPAAGAPTTPAAVNPTPAALRRLLARAAGDLRTRGLRARRFRARAGGFAPGRLTLRLERRSGRPRTLASGTRRVADRRTVTFRPRLRHTLRSRTRARLVLRAIHVTAAGARTTARAPVTLRR